jgi:hypothetical protein
MKIAAHIEQGAVIMKLRPGSRWHIILAVCLLGGIAGALVSIPITWLGKIVGGAPPATLANYIWNMRVLGVMGAVIGPIVMWSALPRVPLWRAVVEPMSACVLAALAGAILGSGFLFLGLPILAIALASWRLNHEFREPPSLLSPPDVEARPSLVDPARSSSPP